MKKIVVAIIAAVLLLFAPIAHSIQQYQTKEGQNVFVWTEQEMEVVNNAIVRLKNENAALKAKLQKYESTCI